jgi:predicted nucleic acid-binding protein
MKTSLRTVPDTNVVIAAQSLIITSPNREYFERWKNEEFDLLFSDDTLREYVKKLVERKVPREVTVQFLASMLELGTYTAIQFFHLAKYPVDPDDIAFLLCAESGHATHLISYDLHLLELDGFYEFKICKTLDFLFEVREILSE